MSSYDCPGSHVAHAGPAGISHWIPRSLRLYRLHDHPVDDLLEYAKKYVVCAECGKSVLARKDGTTRSHPPSRIGPVKEAARRQRALLAAEKALNGPTGAELAAAELRGSAEVAAMELRALRDSIR